MGIPYLSRTPQVIKQKAYWQLSDVSIWVIGKGLSRNLPQTTQATSIIIGYSPELEGKTVLLNTLHT